MTVNPGGKAPGRTVEAKGHADEVPTPDGPPRRPDIRAGQSGWTMLSTALPFDPTH